MVISLALNQLVGMGDTKYVRDIKASEYWHT